MSEFKTYQLHYGDSKVSFAIPAHIKTREVSLANRTSDVPMSDARIKKEISSFMKEYPLERYVHNKKVGLIIPDGTRDIPLKEVFVQLKPLLTSAEELKIVIATGSHDPFLEKTIQIREFLNVELSNRKQLSYEIIIHDAMHAPFVYYGDTRRGTPILINAHVRDLDTYFLLGDLKPHYFAGYSNPLKLILPGISAFKSIEANHKMALDLNNHACLHPLHENPERRSNALMDDIYEANRVFFEDKHVFAAGMISSHGTILDFKIGPLEPTITKLLSRVDQIMSKKISPADITILSCGGSPLDESLYTAQRALELTMSSFKNGGEILFLARCENGLGPKKAKKNFYDLMLKPLKRLEEELEENYVLYSHKALRFLKLLQKVKKVYMMTELEKDLLEPVGIEKITEDELQQVINHLIEKKGRNLSVNIIDDGSKLALYK
ncbi:MAG: nickel-dependent lactate racemase [Calditrichia bacterium]